MKLIQMNTQDAYFNLAAEEYIFRGLEDTDAFFLLWQNRKAVVVGSHQNTIEEINLEFVQFNNVQVARRLTGGGAVFHDLGNLNYSIIVHSDEMRWDIKKMADPVVKALQISGVNVQVNKRNDLLINDKKISGSSQYIKGKRLLHHGTLLFHSDLNTLSLALKPSEDQVESRSIKSVRSQVTNICDHYPKLSIPEFSSSLKDVLHEDSAVEEYELTKKDLEAVSQLRDEKYSTWEWSYGRSPEFSIRKIRRINGKDLDILLVVKNGMIQSLELNGDFGTDLGFDEIVQRLIGVKMLEGEVAAVIDSFELGQYFPGITAEDLTRVIIS